MAEKVPEKEFEYMDVTVRRVSAIDVPLHYDDEIELMALPNTQKVIDAVREVL